MKQNTLHTFMKKYVMIFVLLLLLILFTSLSARFFTASNFSNMFLAEVPGALLALGGMFILITSEFDLSLGYNLCFCMILAAFLVDHLGLTSTFAVVAVTLAAGTLIGLVNGLLVVKLQVSSFIVTLSVGLALSGFSQALSGGGQIYISEPAPLMNFSRGTLGSNGLGYSVLLFLVLAVVMHIMLTRTPFGRHLYAVGVSNKIAYMAGVKTDRVRILAFCCSGFFAALGGVVLIGQLGAASSAFGTSLLLPAYATVFLSKASFKPGYINVPGVILSLLIIMVGSNGIQIAGAPTWGNYIFEGVILCFAMWLSTRFTVSHTVKKTDPEAVKEG